MNNKYKIVFIDIDGTLVNDEKIIPKENIEIIKKLKEDGIEVVLTSGRPYNSIQQYSEKSGAVPYVIGSNGGVAVNFKTETNIFTKAIDKNIALEILKKIKSKNLYTVATISGNLAVETEQFSMTPENRSEVKVVESLDEVLTNTNDPIMKFSVINDEKENIEIFRDEIINLFDLSLTKVDTFVIPRRYRKVENKYALPYIMDIMPKNVSKGEAIKELCKYLNIDVPETVVFGDGLNDIEMFKTGGYTVAMGNAADEIKELADVVTKTNNEAGVAYELNKIFYNF